MFRRKKKDASKGGKQTLGGLFRKASPKPEEAVVPSFPDSDSDYEDSEKIEIYEDEEVVEAVSPSEAPPIEEPIREVSETEADRKARARQAVEERKRKAREAVAARKGRSKPAKEETKAAASERAKLLEEAEAQRRREEEENLRREEAEMKALEEELKKEEEEAKKIAEEPKQNFVEVETVESDDIHSDEDVEYYQAATEKLAAEAEKLAEAEKEKLSAEEAARAEERARWQAEEEETKRLQQEAEELARQEAEMDKLEAELEARAREEEVAKLEAELEEEAKRLKAIDEKCREEEEKRKAEEALLAMQQFIDTTPEEKPVSYLGDVNHIVSPRESEPDLDDLLDGSMSESAFLDAALGGPVEPATTEVPVEEPKKDVSDSKKPSQQSKATKAPTPPAKSRYKKLITPSPNPKRKPKPKPASKVTKPASNKPAPRPTPKVTKPTSKKTVPKAAKPAPKQKTIPKVVTTASNVVPSMPPKVRRSPEKKLPKPAPPASPKATLKSKPTISVKALYSGTTPSSPRSAFSPGGRSIASHESRCTISTIPRSPFMPLPEGEEAHICKNAYIPKMFTNKMGCQVCLFRLSEDEKAVFEKNGRHMRVNLTRGGCFDCKIFPSEEGEDHVRLCKNCFFDTHLLPARKHKPFAGPGALAGMSKGKTPYSPHRKRYRGPRR